MKYLISKENLGQSFLDEVEGIPFILPKYPELQLFSRPCEYMDGIVISEIKTGRRMGEDYYATETDAINDITQRIERMGIDNVYHMIESLKIGR